MHACMHFAKVLYESGDAGLLMPFEEIAPNHVQKLYDLETADFVTPKKRIGKILLHDVFSFRRVQQVVDVTGEQVDLAKSLYEIEIEKRVFKDFSKNDKVDFAIPFVYSAKKGAQERSNTPS